LLLKFLRRGKSGLHRARGQLTAAKGNFKESATEKKPPLKVRVKRWCKRPPVL